MLINVWRIKFSIKRHSHIREEEKSLPPNENTRLPDRERRICTGKAEIAAWSGITRCSVRSGAVRHRPPSKAAIPPPPWPIPPVPAHLTFHPLQLINESFIPTHFTSSLSLVTWPKQTNNYSILSNWVGKIRTLNFRFKLKRGINCWH